MTLSSEILAPLVVVVGSTGVQGGSVVRELIASDKPYRIRGLTRNASKTSAQKIKDHGVEVCEVDIRIGNEAAVQDAFRGGDIVFGVTNFWEHMSKEREVVEGKLMADAASAAGARLFIFSGLPDVTRLSGGKYPYIAHFDGKAEVVAYARTLLPTIDVQAGMYMTNLADPLVAPARQSGDLYVWEQLTNGDPVFPYIDMEHDYGLFVRYAIEHPGCMTIHSYGERLRNSQVAEIAKRVRGVDVKLVVPQSEAAQRAKFQGMNLPSHIVDDLVGTGFTVDFGYYFGQEMSLEQQTIRAGLARRPRSLEEFLKANPSILPA